MALFVRAISCLYMSFPAKDELCGNFSFIYKYAQRKAFFFHQYAACLLQNIRTTYASHLCICSLLFLSTKYNHAFYSYYVNKTAIPHTSPASIPSSSIHLIQRRKGFQSLFSLFCPITWQFFGSFPFFFALYLYGIRLENERVFIVKVIHVKDILFISIFSYTLLASHSRLHLLWPRRQKVYEEILRTHNYRYNESQNLIWNSYKSLMLEKNLSQKQRENW